MRAPPSVAEGRNTCQWEAAHEKDLMRASVLVLTLAMGTLGLLYAQETQQPQPSPDTPQEGQSNQPQPATQAKNAKEFTGTIVNAAAPRC